MKLRREYTDDYLKHRNTKKTIILGILHDTIIPVALIRQLYRDAGIVSHPLPTSCTRKKKKSKYYKRMKKNGKNVMAGRPLVNNHIQRALKIRANVGYETRCCKKSHCPQQLMLSALFT